jgi:hypothetical protein
MVMVLMVAKAFPTSESGWNVYYMIPAYMLTALSGVLLYRIVPTLGLGGGTVRRCFALIFPALLVLIAITQAFGIARLDRNYRNMRDMGLSVGNERFSACARISGYSASSPSFALYNGNLQAGFPFSKQLKELRPENDFWLNISGPTCGFATKRGFPALPGHRARSRRITACGTGREAAICSRFFHTIPALCSGDRAGGRLPSFSLQKHRKANMTPPVPPLMRGCLPWARIARAA